MYRNKRKGMQAYNKLIGIYDKIKNEEISKDLLADLLFDDHPAVILTAGSYMLGLHYEVDRAIDKLNELCNTERKTAELKALRMNARMTIEMYLKDGKLDIGK